MGAEHLIYCPMFLRCTFHDVGREILRHILRRLGASRGCSTGYPVKGSERLVLGAIPLSSGGFAGVKRALGYPCLVRESAPRPVFEGFFGA